MVRLNITANRPNSIRDYANPVPCKRGLNAYPYFMQIIRVLLKLVQTSEL